MLLIILFLPSSLCILHDLGCSLCLNQEKEIIKYGCKCHDSSVVGFLLIDNIVSDSSSLSAKISLGVKRVTSSLSFQAWESRGDVTLRRRGWKLFDKQTASLCPKINLRMLGRNHKRGMLRWLHQAIPYYA